MKRIIYDYESPHIVGRARGSFPVIKIIVFIIIISLAVALIYILFFRDTSERRQSKEYYMVVTGEYHSHTAALAVADEVKAKGGGGFVTESFAVVAAVYPSYDEAQAVADRYDYQVVKSGTSSIKVNLSQAELSQEVARLCVMPEQVFDTIYQISIALDKGELSEAAALHALQGQNEKVNSKISELVRIKDNYMSDKLLYQVEQMLNSLSCCIERQSSYSLSSRLKYCLIEVVFTYKSFLTSIS